MLSAALRDAVGLCAHVVGDTFVDIIAGPLAHLPPAWVRARRRVPPFGGAHGLAVAAHVHDVVVVLDRGIYRPLSRPQHISAFPVRLSPSRRRGRRDPTLGVVGCIGVASAVHGGVDVVVRHPVTPSQCSPLSRHCIRATPSQLPIDCIAMRSDAARAGDFGAPGNGRDRTLSLQPSSNVQVDRRRTSPPITALSWHARALRPSVFTLL